MVQLLMAQNHKFHCNFVYSLYCFDTLPFRENGSFCWFSVFSYVFGWYQFRFTGYIISVFWVSLDMVTTLLGAFAPLSWEQFQYSLTTLKLPIFMLHCYTLKTYIQCIFTAFSRITDKRIKKNYFHIVATYCGKYFLCFFPISKSFDFLFNFSFPLFTWVSNCRSSTVLLQRVKIV